MKGLDFLKKKYDLHNAPELASAARRTEVREGGSQIILEIKSKTT